MSGVQHLSQGWERNVLVMEEASSKNPNFVKDVPMMRVNLIIVVIVVPEKRKGITFVKHSCTIELLSL